MSISTDTYVRTLAMRALNDAGITEPPIDIERVAESLGVPIRRVNLPGFFKGAVVNEEGMPVLLVNCAQPPSRQRQVIAHLLGHVLLVLDGRSYPRNQRDHDDADAVAIELLMPAQLVDAQAKLWFNDYRYLARMFSADEGVMLQRMRTLGIIKGPRGIVWDY